MLCLLLLCFLYDKKCFIVHLQIRSVLYFHRELMNLEMFSGTPPLHMHTAQFTGFKCWFIHSESKKLRHCTCVCNFDECWPIFKIFSLLYQHGFCWLTVYKDRFFTRLKLLHKCIVTRVVQRDERLRLAVTWGSSKPQSVSCRSEYIHLLTESRRLLVASGRLKVNIHAQSE